ncbi:hypothetical protein [Sphingomonas sp. LC-1]|uniref:hypothetical protein n=1 Tax=Sphingomonas sp. LC-1 TaxID=3110957 RepID=UPI0021BAB27C|nr:hypothetical protein [Sphingomonas sp. LC-1]
MIDDSEANPSDFHLTEDDVDTFFGNGDEKGRQSEDIGASIAAGIEEAVRVIKATAKRGAFDIKGTVIFEDAVLRVKTLKVFNSGKLAFSNMLSFPFIAIAADEVIIDNPQVRAIICRPVGIEFDLQIAEMLKGADGGKAQDGVPGQGTSQRRGVDGGNGYEGPPGGTGGTLNLPPIFLFIKRIRLGTGTKPQSECVELFFDGLPGGRGGKGGRGGNGGIGANGQRSSSGFGFCRSGGGDGGHGGYGGMPGRGGDAGRGGNGAAVFFVAASDPIEMLKFFSVRQEGGVPGEPGFVGQPGRGGRAGEGGQGSVHCHGGQRGHDRFNEYVRRPDDGRGAKSLAGARGDQDYIERDNGDIF